MITIDVKSDLDKMFKAASNLSAHFQDKATTRALNYTIKQARTEAVRTIRRTYTVKASTLNKAIRIYKANKYRLAAALDANGSSALPIIDFGRVRQTATGVSFTIRQDRGGKALPHAFIATMANGHKGVFMRKETKRIMTKGRYAGKLRHPIEEKFTVGVPRQFLARTTTDAMTRTVRDVFPRRLIHEVGFLLGLKESEEQ